ncbi:MAG TPA: OmpA family protein, partial [Bacteroidetes bacterium]|nr:OmpA family protein [Bacteroidota bacterium]
MKRFFTRALVLLLAVGFAQLANAQQTTPKDMVEVGVHGGLMFVSGDVSSNFGTGGGGYGVGIHVRKALDHIFSLRVDGDFGKATGSEASIVKSYETSWMSGTVSGIVTVNNMRFDKPHRKVNLYLALGAGLNKYSTKADYGTGSLVDVPNTGDMLAHATMGAGIALRLSPRFNLGLEHDVFMPMGGSIDLLDGRQNFPSSGGDVDRTPYRDLMNFTNLRLNFNLGKGDKMVEPLYWVNPLTPVLNDIAELKARPVLDMGDDDNDGVPNSLDKEEETPAGAPVNASGVALDSDGDGIINLNDKEPFSPPGYKISKDGVAMIPPEPKITEGDVNKIVDAKLADFKSTFDGGGTLTDWFLPMIHFNLNHYDIRKQEYEKLYQVATVLKNNPKIKVVVTGFTDKTARDDYNNVLSYNRAMAAIQHLVNVHGIDRSRLILNYGGEGSTLVPTEGRSFVNRRVEFKV